MGLLVTGRTGPISITITTSAKLIKGKITLLLIIASRPTALLMLLLLVLLVVTVKQNRGHGKRDITQRLPEVRP